MQVHDTNVAWRGVWGGKGRDGMRKGAGEGGGRWLGWEGRREGGKGGGRERERESQCRCRGVNPNDTGGSEY